MLAVHHFGEMSHYYLWRQWQKHFSECISSVICRCHIYSLIVLLVVSGQMLPSVPPRFLASGRSALRSFFLSLSLSPLLPMVVCLITLLIVALFLWLWQKFQSIWAVLRKWRQTNFFFVLIVAPQFAVLQFDAERHAHRVGHCEVPSPCLCMTYLLISHAN